MYVVENRWPSVVGRIERFASTSPQIVCQFFLLKRQHRTAFMPNKHIRSR